MIWAPSTVSRARKYHNHKRILYTAVVASRVGGMSESSARCIDWTPVACAGDPCVHPRQAGQVDRPVEVGLTAFARRRATCLRTSRTLPHSNTRHSLSFFPPASVIVKQVFGSCCHLCLLMTVYCMPSMPHAVWMLSSRYESTENMSIQCSTKVCSFGKQVVEKVEVWMHFSRTVYMK